MYYQLRVPGDGSCLFTSLRLGLEVQYVLAHDDTRCNLDAKSNEVRESTLKLRHLLVDWYQRFPTRRISSENNETRKSILELECSGTRHTPSEYLERMRFPSAWGSTPEYLAFAHVCKLNVYVHQKNIVIDRVLVPGAKGSVHLLYSNRNHYDLLITEQEYEDLEARFFMLARYTFIPQAHP